MIKNTQQQILLSQLKQGSVNSYFATYSLRIKQAPTRIKELKEAGYQIISKPNKDRSVDWRLVGSPVVKEVVKPKNDYSNYVFSKDGRAYIPDPPKQEVLL